MGLLDIKETIENSPLVDFVFMQKRNIGTTESWFYAYTTGIYEAYWRFNNTHNINIDNTPYEINLLPELLLQYDLNKTKKFNVHISPSVFEHPDLTLPIEYREVYRDVKHELNILLKPFQDKKIETVYDFELTMDALKLVLEKNGYKRKFY
jgi:hypothetical protein